MESLSTNEFGFDEKQSIKIIKSAIASAKNALMEDGLLLIIWGAAFSISNFWNYYESVVLTSWWVRNLKDILQIGMGIGVVIYTLYFIFFRKRNITTIAAISTRYVWFGVILAHNINIIIAKNILNQIDFALLQPLQMVLIGFALFVTGGIYRYYLLLAAGVTMWIAAAICANYDLNTQYLIRSIAEVLCFVVPGVLMYSARKK